MIEEILPASVTSFEALGDDLTDTWLFPEERQVIARAVDKRRHEFTAARGCARRALEKLGIPAAPILPGERGAPQWPPGVTGSITHCAGYHAAVVAHAADIAALGIDAEPHGPLPAGVLSEIARPEELAHLRALENTAPAVHWDRLLFSAKESVYKTWFPVARRWLDFHEATLEFRDDGTFSAHLLVPDPPPILGRHIHGRWLIHTDLALTAIAIARTESPGRRSHQLETSEGGSHDGQSG